MPEPTPHLLEATMRDAYMRYYDTAFWLRDETLRRERRELLEAEGVVFTEPLIEPVIPYESGPPLSDVCAEAGLSADLADALGEMLFGADGRFRLRHHQAEALKVSTSGTDVRNVAITSGTGSGKTEAFLLPVVARILAEAL